MNMGQQLPQFIYQEATAILDEIERELSQWYGDRRLAA